MTRGRRYFGALLGLLFQRLPNVEGIGVRKNKRRTKIQEFVHFLFVILSVTGIFVGQGWNEGEAG